MRRLAAIPLRHKLVGITVSLIMVTLLVTVAATAGVMRRHLAQQIDDELVGVSGTVAQITYADLLARQQLVPTNFTLRMQPIGQQVLFHAGEAVTADGEEPAIPYLAVNDPRVDSQVPFDVGPHDGTGSDWRVIAGRFHDGSAIYTVSVPLASVDEAVRAVIMYSAGGGLVLLIAAGILGWYAVRRAFQPVSEIEDTAAAVAAGDVSRRIPVPRAEDEVASLARSLNVMLGQVTSSLDRAESSEAKMRQFVADASHELRTPLVAIRGYAELYRQGAITQPQDIASAMRRIEDEARRMTILVEDLLMLARLDRDTPLAHGPVDLTVICTDAVQDATAIDPRRTVRLIGLGGPVRPVNVVGDERRLRQVLANLLVNAIRHTPAGTRIEVAVGHLPDGKAAFEVRDHGQGIAESARAKIFERFYRTDASRHRGTGGTGLGLAIVAAIVNAHRGVIDVRDTPGGGATFSVQLPTGASYQESSKP